MKYESTRGSKNEKTGAQAIIQGIAEDRGLYVPVSLPDYRVRPEQLKGKTYKEIATAVIGAFFDDYTPAELRACIDGAYDGKFAAEDVVPVVKAGDAYFLELYHGRTAAFKDMALSLLPYLMTTVIKKEGVQDKICILTATSGDTGKAALAGFADVPGTEIIVFFPNHGVSQVQERQMVSQTGKNTHVFAIEGNFDDAQTGVKKIFDDAAFNRMLADRGIRLSSANSINIGRLVPQIVYYVYGYAKMMEQGAVQAGEKINIVVPTGNFGNILAAYLARELGLPVGKFICASNENKVLTDFINTGIYDTKRGFYCTNSPSMDILISSNLERLLYLLCGRDGAQVSAWMTALAQEGRYTVSEAVRTGMQDFYGGFADETQTLETIGRMYRENHYLIDTHTAVAYGVYAEYRKKTGDNTPTLIASTASPYKFAEAVSKAIGLPRCADGFAYMEELEKQTGVSIPAGLAGLAQQPVRHRGVCAVAQMEAAVSEALQSSAD